MNDKPEWEKQLNCYAYLVRKNKERAVSKLQIVAILRDWSRRKAMTEKDYPKSQVIMVDVPLWEFEQQEAYLETRISISLTASSPVQVRSGGPSQHGGQ